MIELLKRLRMLKPQWKIKTNKQELIVILMVAFILVTFAYLHVRSVKRNQDNTIHEDYLKKEIQDRQEEIDMRKQDISELQDKMSTLKTDVVFIDSKSQTNKKKYTDEKRYIDLATPSQQSTLLSANLSEFKDLDRQGYFDLPEGR